MDEARSGSRESQRENAASTCSREVRTVFIAEVIDLYRTLDFARVDATMPDSPIQLFNRMEGAAVTHELLWVLGKPESHQKAYGVFSSQIQRLINIPGQKRMRLVAHDEGELATFNSEYSGKYNLSTDVSRHSWISLINNLFRSDQFCRKIMSDYGDYRDNLSIQISGIADVADATWSYSPQTLRRSNDDRVSFETFLKDVVDTTVGDPKLFVIHAPASYGKTAFSYAATRHLAQQHDAGGLLPFPIFIPFAKYRRFGGVRDILRAEIEELQLYGVNSRALLRLIHWGRAVVVLDGFDELIAEVGYDSARTNLRALREFLDGQARLLLTTRTAFLSTNAEVLGALEPDDKEEIEIVRLEPFDREGQKTYLGSIGLSSSETESTLAYLDSFPTLPAWITSPLLLNTVARLAKKGEQSPPRINQVTVQS